MQVHRQAVGENRRRWGGSRWAEREHDTGRQDRLETPDWTVDRTRWDGAGSRERRRQAGALEGHGCRTVCYCGLLWTIVDCAGLLVLGRGEVSQVRCIEVWRRSWRSRWRRFRAGEVELRS